MRLSLLEKHRHLRLTLVIKTALAIIPVATFLVLINEHLFFTPSLTYTYHPGSSVNVIKPKDATQLLRTGDPQLRWKITADNMPFNVTLPRQVDTVKITATLATGTQPLVTLHASGVKGTDLSTLAYSTYLNDLSWTRITDGVTTLWQRTKTFSTVEEFRRHPPDLSKVATVGIDHMTLASNQMITNSTTPITFTQTFRGSHQFYVYISRPTYNVSLDKIDLNRTNGADGLTIRIAKADTLTSDNRHWLNSISVGDDGNSGKNGPKGSAQHLALTTNYLQPGVYLVEVFTTNDVTFTNLASSERGLAFAGSVWLAEGPAYEQPGFSPATFSTNSSTLTFAVQHDQGKQSIGINGKKISINDTKGNHQVSRLVGETSFIITKGDIRITGDGLLSIQPAALLSDGMKELDLGGTPNLDSVDYVVANYQPQTNNTITVSHEYQVIDLALAQKTLGFSIEASGMQANGTTLGLKSLRVTMSRGTLPWSKLRQKAGL